MAIDVIFSLHIFTLLASFAGVHTSANYIQLTTFPHTASVETIEPTMPPPCRPVSATPDIKKVPVKATVYQIHPKTQKFGVVCKCIHRITETTKPWYYFGNITLSDSELNYDCSDIKKEIKDKLEDNLKGDFYKSIIPYNTKVLDLTTEKIKFPWIGSSTNHIWRFNCTKMPFSQDIHYRLVDPYPQDTCTQVPCKIDPNTLFYTDDFKDDENKCFLMKLTDMTGLIIYESLSPGKLVLFTSDARGRDLSFSGGEKPTIECTTDTKENILLSLEGVYVSFKPNSKGEDPLLSLYGPQNKTKRQTGIIRTIQSSKTLDVITMSQQNIWISSKMSLDDSGIYHLLHTTINSTIYDLLTIKHMQCELKRRQHMTAYYIAEQFPVPYLTYTFPDNPFILINRKPIKIKRGSKLLFQISSLPSDPFCYGDRLKLIINQQNCTIQNVSGIYHCDTQNTPASPCINTLNTFILPTTDGLWYDIMTHRHKDQSNDYSLYLNLFDRSYTPLAVNYEQESSYFRAFSDASLMTINTSSDLSLDNSWGKEVDDSLDGLSFWKSILKYVLIALVGLCAVTLTIHMKLRKCLCVGKKR